MSTEFKIYLKINKYKIIIYKIIIFPFKIHAFIYKCCLDDNTKFIYCKNSSGT